MDKKPNLNYFHAKGLLPFQAQFALTFLQEKTKPYQELVAPTGTGKTRLASSVIVFELEENVNKRILVIAPARLLSQWKFELLSQLSSISVDVSPLVVDRKTYLDRELNVAAGEPVWPTPAIILMSTDLARREDMASRLLGTNWDLVVVDESHLLAGKLKSLFESLKNSRIARRALLLTAVEPYLRGDSVTRIQLKDIVDWNGDSLLISFERHLGPIYYRRTEEECNFIRELSDFAESLREKSPYGKFQSTSILRSASSSIYATEKSIRRLLDIWKPMRNKIMHSMPLADEDLERIPRQLELITDDVIQFEEPPEIIAVQLSSAQMNDYVAMYNKLELLLDQISEIPYDSKLEALISYLKRSSIKNGKKHICIWSSFASTAHYLSSNIREITESLFIVTGNLDVKERFDSVSAFQEQGGILIATDAASLGVDLGYVSECINYDLPLNKGGLEQRWGRFLRFGRKGAFEMVVLVDETNTFKWEVDLFQTFQDAMSYPDPD